MGENKNTEEVTVEQSDSDCPHTETSNPQPASPKKKMKRWPIVVGVIALVVIVSGVGFSIWHEQPSFCNAICHTPMDPYDTTYNQNPNTQGVDKWGNAVEDTSSMLCVAHKIPTDQGGAGATCMSCHVATLSEQITEGTNWITGNYAYPLDERTTKDLTAARGVDADQFCLNKNCHNMTRQDLVKATSSMPFNPHVSEHGESACTDCHKGHRASVLTCTKCHQDVVPPKGWLSAQQDAALQKKTFPEEATH